MIHAGDIVKVTAPGRWHEQEARVLREHQSQIGARLWYLLNVQWDGTPRPSWFEDYEVEKIEQEEGREQVL